MAIASGPGIGREPNLAETGVSEQGPIDIQQQSGADTGPLLRVRSSAGAVLSSVDNGGNLALAGHLSATNATLPTVAAGAAAGGTPPAPVAGAGANDQRGTLTFGTGTAPAAGAMVAVTFAAAFAAAPAVVIVAGNTATQALGLYVSSVLASGFTVSCTTAPAVSQPNTTYSVAYMVMG